MNMNWLNTNYILRAGVLSVLLLLPGLISATCKADTIINSYKDDSLRFIIKDDSIITFRTGDSIFTIIRADSVLPVTPKQVKHSRYDNRIHRFRSHWERIIPTHSKIQYAGNMGLLLSVRDGITGNIISGKRIYCSDLYRNIRQRRPK